VIPNLDNTSLGFAKFASAATRVNTPPASPVVEHSISTGALSETSTTGTNGLTAGITGIKPKAKLTADQFSPVMGRSLFFSTQAIRAQLLQFLGEVHNAKNDFKQLVFDFNRLEDMVAGPESANQAALIITPVRGASPDKTKSTPAIPRMSFGKILNAATESAPTITQPLHQTNTPPPEPIAPLSLKVRQIEYRNFVHTDAVPTLQTMVLPALEKKDGVVQPNIMLTADNQVIAKPQFDQKGVQRVVNPFWQPLFGALRPLTDKSPFNQWVSIQENGQTTLFKRFSFNWVEHYQDINGQRLRPFALEKLPNGTIVDVKNFENHPRLRVNKINRKHNLNTLETIIRGIDAQHFTLAPATVQDNIKPTLLATTPANNPFQQVGSIASTSGTVTQPEP